MAVPGVCQPRITFASTIHEHDLHGLELVSINIVELQDAASENALPTENVFVSLYTYSLP